MHGSKVQLQFEGSGIESDKRGEKMKGKNIRQKIQLRRGSRKLKISIEAI